MTTEQPERGTPPGAPGEDELESIVAAFILDREEGRNPSIDDYLTRHPRHAEALARLLSYDTHPPARRTAARAGPSSAPALRLGPYEVIDHVSTAGGGTVYRARHVEGGHVVALKVLDARGAVDARDIERFRREAGMLRALDLVRVVPVLEVGHEAGRSWIAMKWLDGDTLGKLREPVRQKSHPLHDRRERARLVAAVARTFAAIHGYGILHRDVKPSNIMVDRAGEPMIIDFGIAQAPDLPELTATTDQLMGTPRYLAPELLAGGNRVVSVRTDVYGLGLCLYELCTGSEAFRHEARADLFTAIRTTGPLHPRKADPAISRDLAAVILRAIEIDPARRYSDMTAFADDLERVANGEPPELVTLRGAHPVLRALRRNRRRLIAAACLAAVLVPAIWLTARRVLDGVEARAREQTLRPFAWFAPEAFAGGLGVPAGALAADLAGNRAATPEQRLLAAWIPFLSGNVKEALANAGTSDAAGDGFAARLFRDHLKDLTDPQPSGGFHVASTFIDRETSRPAVNPRTGGEYVALVPIDHPGGSAARDAARFDAAVERIASETPPVLPLDHLVLATLSWSLVSNDPGVDTGPRRAAIERSLASAADSEATRVPAVCLRGVLRFLAADLASARRDLEAVVLAQPAAIGARYLLGVVCTRTGDPSRGCELLEAVARELPASHPARGRMLGHLAIARAAAGRLSDGVAACEQWWTAPGAGAGWQDAVIPRAVAARLHQDRGDLASARDLLLAAVREEERIKLADQEAAERGSGDPLGPIVLWEPAIRDLAALAETLNDAEVLEECRAKRQSAILMAVPESAERYLDLNLVGLRAPDANRRMIPLPTVLPR